MKKSAGNRSRRPLKACPLPIWGVPVNLKLRISQAEFGCRPGPLPHPTSQRQYTEMGGGVGERAGAASTQVDQTYRWQTGHPQVERPPSEIGRASGRERVCQYV